MASSDVIIDQLVPGSNPLYDTSSVDRIVRENSTRISKLEYECGDMDARICSIAKIEYNQFRLVFAIDKIDVGLRTPPCPITTDKPVSVGDKLLITEEEGLEYGVGVFYDDGDKAQQLITDLNSDFEVLLHVSNAGMRYNILEISTYAPKECI